MDPLYPANRRQERRQFNERHPLLPSLQRRNSGDGLLHSQEVNEIRPQPRYRPEPSTIITHELDYRSQQQRQNSFCFPRFLTCIGQFCIPCKVYCPCCCCSCCHCTNDPIFIQQMTSLGLLQQWGRYIRVLEPGLHMINPISQSIIEVNQQTQIYNYQQMAISKDNVQFRVAVVVLYRFVDSLKVAYRLGDMNAEECLMEIASGSMRTIAGENQLQEIIQNRNLVCDQLTQHINKMIQYWGIHIEVSSLKDIWIDKDIQKVLQSVAVARRTKQAMLISYQVQSQCALLYKELNSNPGGKASYQVRYLNAIDNIISQTLDKENVIFLKTTLQEKDGGSNRSAQSYL